MLLLDITIMLLLDITITSHWQFSKAVESLNAEMLWTMMYIYGSLDYPAVVVSDLRIKSNQSLGETHIEMSNLFVRTRTILRFLINH